MEGVTSRTLVHIFSDDLISYFVLHFSACFLTSPPPDLLCGYSCLVLLLMRTPEHPAENYTDISLAFLNYWINSLLIWFIISWMNPNSQLILSGLPVSWFLLLQNINDYLSTMLLSQWCRRTSAVFRGHTVELCYSNRLLNDFRPITALNPWGY